MREPSEECGEGHEGKKGSGEFFATGRDSTVSLDPAEEVFDVMASAVIASMVGGGMAATLFWRDAMLGVPVAEFAADDIRIEAPVGNHSPSTQLAQDRNHLMLIVPGPRS